MATLSVSIPKQCVGTVAELLHRLGDLPADRVWLEPSPGTATEQDLLRAHDRDGRLRELVDGTLVEKAMGLRESMLAILLGELLGAFVRAGNLGIVAGADGPFRLLPGLVRLPDLAYVSWSRIPSGAVPTEPIPAIVPDLAVEVLSEGNTPAEIARKLDEYLRAGVQLVWVIDPRRRTAAVHRATGASLNLDESGTLDGTGVLPGFSVPLRKLFAELDRHATP
jgi:Uma2 family endonuclease